MGKLKLNGNGNGENVGLLIPKCSNKKERIQQIYKRPKEKFLNENQKLYWDILDKNQITLCIGPAGVGKAQPLSTPILTPDGWVKMDDIIIGSKVFNENGEIVNVIAVHPQGKKEVYSVIFSDGSSTECCIEHLWLTDTHNDRNNRKKINNKRIFSPKDGTVKNLLEIKNSLYTKRGYKNHTIPITKPVNFPNQEIIIDPYIMGVLIGDGSFTQNRITFTSKDQEIINNVKLNLNESVILSKIKSAIYEYSIVGNNNNNPYLNYLKELGLIGKKSESKFIPLKYLYNSIENRIKLLHGLMDTDGTISKNGYTMSFSTSSKHLINDFIILINSLGGITSLTKKKPYYYNKERKKIMGLESYTVTIKLPNEITPFKLERKLEKVVNKTRYKPKRYITDIKFIGEKECKCITIDSKSNLYLTEHFIVTHNSFIAMKKAIDLLYDENNKYEKIMIVRPAVEAEEKLGSLPGNLEEKLDPYIYPSYYLLNKIIGKEAREQLKKEEFIEIQALAYLRGWNVDNTILIFEEGQNTSPSQMKLLLTRLGYNSKFFISGDLEQSDKFKNITHSGLYDAKKRLKNLPDVGFFEFFKEDIVRNPLISQILERYEN